MPLSIEVFYLYKEAIMAGQRREVQTLPIGDSWVNKVGGAQFGDPFKTQEAAAAVGRQLAIENQSEHFIHGTDGKIREKKSYGNDPREIRG